MQILVNKGNILWKKIEDRLNPIASTLKGECENYKDALNAFKATTEFIQSHRDLQDIFFWQAGKYNLSIENQYANKKAIFNYTFTLQQYDIDKLNDNIDKVLISILSEKYNIPMSCETPAVDLTFK